MWLATHLIGRGGGDLVRNRRLLRIDCRFGRHWLVARGGGGLQFGRERVVRAL